MTGAVARAGSNSPPLRWGRVAAAAVPAYVAGALLLVLVDPVAHATRTPLTLTATLVAAGMLLVGGCLTQVSRRYRAAAILGLIAGGLWLGSGLVGWLGGPVWLRALALLAAPFLVPVLFHLVLTVPAPRASDRLRRASGAVYALTGLLTALVAVTRDPLFDPYCWNDCNLRVLAVLPTGGLARTAADLGLLLVFLLAVAALALTTWRLSRAGRGSRAGLIGIGMPAVVALLASGVGAAALAIDPPERRQGGWFQGAYLLQVGGFLLLGAGLVLLAAIEWRRGLRLRQLAGRLGTVPPVGTLEEHLAQVLEDPTVQVAHWLPESGRFFSSSGHPVTPRRPPARTTVELRRGLDLLALVTTDRSDLDADELSAQLGAATRLAIDNERLQAGVRAQLAELQESRVRVVEAADLSRRQLERDLHDGVQADLVGLLLDVSRRRASALRRGDDRSAALLDAVVERVSAAVAALRELTHGIYPAELAEAGLEAALWTLIDDAPVPVTLHVTLDRRPEPAVEQAAYVVALEALRGASEVSLDLSVTLSTDTLHVSVIPAPGDPPLGLHDRVGALGGQVRRTETSWEVTLPCESSSPMTP